VRLSDLHVKTEADVLSDRIGLIGAAVRAQTPADVDLIRAIVAGLQGLPREVNEKRPGERGAEESVSLSRFGSGRRETPGREAVARVPSVKSESAPFKNALPTSG
jgi:hypothetical protein